MKAFTISMIYSLLLFVLLEKSISFQMGYHRTAVKSMFNIANRCHRSALYQLPESSSNFEKSNAVVADSSQSPKSKRINPKVVILSVVAMVLAAAVIGGFRTIDLDITGLLDKSLLKIASLGPYGYLYFAMIYVVAEVLCIPAIPLAASSGYLFGLVPGFLTVLLSATVASCISFFIGRTLLRGWAQKIASGSERWRAIDSAIGKEGFKVILLLRVTPIFPFSIVNYLYGLTSVNFWPYFFATLLGFTPGTLGIVYAGTAGKAIFSKGMGDLPWYFYAAAGGLGLVLGKAVTKFASSAMKAIEAEGAAPTQTQDAMLQPTDEALADP